MLSTSLNVYDHCLNNNKLIQSYQRAEHSDNVHEEPRTRKLPPVDGDAINITRLVQLRSSIANSSALFRAFCELFEFVT